MALQQLTGRLDLQKILEGILGNKEKAPRAEIQMKEIGRLLKSAKGLPAPLLASSFGLQNDPFLAQVKDKMVLEGGIALINAQGKESPDGQPEEKPQKGEKQEGKDLYFLESQQDSRYQGKKIDDNNDDPDLRLAKKVTA
jgi:hypothetical protein